MLNRHIFLQVLGNSSELPELEHENGIEESLPKTLNLASSIMALPARDGTICLSERPEGVRDAHNSLGLFSKSLYELKDTKNNHCCTYTVRVLRQQRVERDFSSWFGGLMIFLVTTESQKLSALSTKNAFGDALTCIENSAYIVEG